MTELYPTDADLNALSGATDPEQEVLFLPIGESPYHTSFYRMLYRLLDVSRRAGDLRVYKDGDLTFGVRPGRWMNGQAEVVYVGSEANALANNLDNYIYLLPDGTLTTNTTGLPDPVDQPHLPLAKISTSLGTYAHGDITDLRGRALYRPCGGLVGDLEAQAVSLIPTLSITAAAEVSDVRTLSVQVCDAAGSDQAGRFVIRTWLAESEFAAPSATGNSVAVSAGSALRQIQANADYELISDSSGLVSLDVTITSTATRYLMAEIDGKIYSSGPVDWA